MMKNWPERIVKNIIDDKCKCVKDYANDMYEDDD